VGDEHASLIWLVVCSGVELRGSIDVRMMLRYRMSLPRSKISVACERVRVTSLLPGTPKGATCEERGCGMCRILRIGRHDLRSRH
jgi:hypothetical protein